MYYFQSHLSIKNKQTKKTKQDYTDYIDEIVKATADQKYHKADTVKSAAVYTVLMLMWWSKTFHTIPHNAYFH